MHRMTAHAAAVKALAWCPFQSNLLASGGGTADRSIKFWNTHTGALLNSIDTGSQVCWRPHCIGLSDCLSPPAKVHHGFATLPEQSSMHTGLECPRSSAVFKAKSW